MSLIELNKDFVENKLNIEEAIKKIIDTELSKFGEFPKQFIYYYLKNEFKITKKEIPTHLEEFSNVLNKIFGIGGKLIEIQIVKEIFNKTKISNIDYKKNKEFTLANYVSTIKKLD